MGFSRVDARRREPRRRRNRRIEALRVRRASGANVPQAGFSDVQVYDPVAGSWETSAAGDVAPMPLPRGGTGRAVFAQGEFYVLGGEDDVDAFAEVQVYDPVDDTWRMDRPLPTARHGIHPVLFEGRIFVFGGGLAAGFGFSDGRGALAALSRGDPSTPRRRVPRGARRCVLPGAIFAGMTRPAWFAPALIALVAVVLRVIYVLLLRDHPLFESPNMDAGYHLAWARAVAGGEEFQDGPFFRRRSTR